MKLLRLSLPLFFCLSLISLAHGQNTEIMIRARAHDAKFVGSSVGGARILVKNTNTGEILDQGRIKGSTGSREKLMESSYDRHTVLSDEDTGGFLAELDIDDPTFITIEVYSPKNAEQAQVLSTTQLWAIPGKDITGDGVVLEVPGFIVDVLAPQRHETLDSDEKMAIRANIVMMCGCPITEGGLWDSDDYEVKAIITDEDGHKEKIPMHITDKTSTFAGEAELDSGFYEVLVYAYDSETGNTGVDRTDVVIK